MPEPQGAKPVGADGGEGEGHRHRGSLPLHDLPEDPTSVVTLAMAVIFE